MANKLHVRFWEVPKDAANNQFHFPERTQQDPMFYSPMLNKANSGICISGGGTVSAALIAGYYKALVENNIMDRVAYISGVSGGCWGSTPYAYMEDLADSNFYAAVKAPADYVKDKKQAKDGKTWVETNPDNSMTSAVTHAKIVDLTLENMDHKHEAYERAVGTIFLHPFNIKSPLTDVLAKRHYFTSDGSAAEDIVARNTHLEEDYIMTMVDNRPYLIMNTTLLVEDPTPVASDGGSKSEPNYDRYHFEFTPIYAGMFARFDSENNHTQNKLTLGGSYVETIGFNTHPQSTEINTIETENEYRFELCEPVGTSGSAIEKEILESNHKVLADWLPKFNYWNPAQYVADPAAAKEEELFFGDGGILENTGIISMLLRSIENIATFISQPIYLGEDFDPQKGPNVMELFGYNEIACLFGEELLGTEKEGDKVVLTKTKDPVNRQVFDNSNGEFFDLINAFKSARATKSPLIYNHQLKVVDNELFGINLNGADYEPTVVWSAIDTWEAFNEALPTDISDQIGKPGQLEDFPKVKVFGENKGHVIQLTPMQANLLGSYGYELVTQNLSTYRSLLTMGKMIEEDVLV